MQGMSERGYAAHAGLSRGAIQKAKSSGRLVLHAARLDRRRGRGWPQDGWTRPVQEPDRDGGTEGIGELG